MPREEAETHGKDRPRDDGAETGAKQPLTKGQEDCWLLCHPRAGSEL